MISVKVRTLMLAETHRSGSGFTPVYSKNIKNPIAQAVIKCNLS